MTPFNLTNVLLFSIFSLQAQLLDLQGQTGCVTSEHNSITSYPFRIEDTCIRGGDVPVTYKFFSVKRLRSKVDLVWETSWEFNNSGFEIQRKMGNGEWKKVAFVFTQALDGNSNSVLTYEYTDVNTGKEGSQYRLRQLDKDLSASFSEVRVITGY